MRAAALLGVHRLLLIGHLQELWWWALDCTPPDGDLGDTTAAEIEAAACWGGEPGAFVSALLAAGGAGRAGFLESKPGGGFQLHDWHDYAGKLLERRAKDRERKRGASGGPSDEPPQDGAQNSSGIPVEPPADVQRSRVRTQPTQPGKDSRTPDSLPPVESPTLGSAPPAGVGSPGPRPVTASGSEAPARSRRPQRPDPLKPVVGELVDDFRTVLRNSGVDIGALDRDWHLKAAAVMRRLLQGDTERTETIRDALEYLYHAKRLRSHPACVQEAVANWPRLLQDWNTTPAVHAATPDAWRYRRLSVSERNSLEAQLHAGAVPVVVVDLPLAEPP